MKNLYHITFEYEQNGRTRMGSKQIDFDVKLNEPSLIRRVEQYLCGVFRASSLAIVDLRLMGA